MIGKTISHYRIIDKLGEGGMGEVYLAQDTKLNRRVALKFLPVQLASDGELKERFKREAQAAAALNHPNIITIHEVAEYETRPFIAMEYVEGESLKDVIVRKELSIGEALDIALQISDGLAVAHQAGIVHRDIKPQNVLMGKDGRVRICDFGLAKAKRDVTLTQAGSTLGTIAYMSPEQAQGKELDQRGDIFSFGVVLYEMVTSQLPFKGEQEVAVINSIVNDTPEPLARYKSDVPGELQRIVAKTLEKDRKMRYQHADDLGADLRKLKVELESAVTKTCLARAKASPSIAVLPFRDMSAQKDQEYFCEGMAEELINAFVKVEGLRVVARTSSFSFRDKDVDIRDIGKKLKVGMVLEGSVRKAGNKLRITAQLVKVADGCHVWSEKYDRDLEDIFSIQDEIAQNIVQALEVQLSGKEKRALEAKPTKNIDAYQAYLRGLDYAGRPDYSEEDFRLATQMFERAVELDPEFALAHADLSKAHSALCFHGHDRTEGRVSKAREAVDRALKLQPDLPDAHLALGYFHYWCGQEFDQALGEFAIAEKELPNDARILAVVAAIHKRQGKFQKTVELYMRAFELSPRDAGLPHEIGCAYMTTRRYAEAECYYDRSISLAPDQVLAYVCKAWNCWLRQADLEGGRATLQAMPKRVDSRSGQLAATRFEWFRVELFARNYRKALDELARVSVVFDEGQWWFIPKDQLMAYTYQLMGEPLRARALYESALDLLERELKERPDDDRVHSSLGMVYAGLGRKEEAIREGKLGVELVPVSKNAVIGPFRADDLAFIYVLTGEHDDAIDQIESLLSIPCWLSVPLLRLDPRWDPLRDHPRFQKLLEGEG
jgi:non-specific serine/threonine protein kinase